jgi:hypothetical protein
MRTESSRNKMQIMRVAMKGALRGAIRAITVAAVGVVMVEVVAEEARRFGCVERDLGRVKFGH